MVGNVDLWLVVRLAGNPLLQLLLDLLVYFIFKLLFSPVLLLGFGLEFLLFFLLKSTLFVFQSFHGELVEVNLAHFLKLLGKEDVVVSVGLAVVNEQVLGRVQDVQLGALTDDAPEGVVLDLLVLGESEGRVHKHYYKLFSRDSVLDVLDDSGEPGVLLVEFVKILLQGGVEENQHVASLLVADLVGLLVGGVNLNQILMALLESLFGKMVGLVFEEVFEVVELSQSLSQPGKEQREDEDSHWRKSLLN